MQRCWKGNGPCEAPTTRDQLVSEIVARSPWTANTGCEVTCIVTPKLETVVMVVVGTDSAGVTSTVMEVVADAMTIPDEDSDMTPNEEERRPFGLATKNDDNSQNSEEN
jgi:hypothetical protein